MREKLKSARKALRGNSGSGIVLVLVCMLCVSILGVMVMYLSYTGLLLKVTERQSKTDFYDASTAMDEIRAGIQNAASDSIGAAYKTVLINYSNADYTRNTTMENQFKSEFLSNILSSDLFYNGQYKVETLQSFASGSAQVTGSGTVSSSASGVVLKGVTVSYTDDKGYTTAVTSDISIGVPEFSYVVSNYSVSSLPAFALIAKNTLLESGGVSALNLSGSAYAGNITAEGSGALNITNGTMVCKGLVSINGAALAGDSARLVLGDNTSGATLWANRIEVGGGSSVLLQGNTYVQDDLDLSGVQAAATLSGSYYGFGNSLTDSTKSSAILVNGTHTTLDLSGLTRLMLAGHSFVSNPSNAGTTTDVLMGESTSVRGNQRAYLVPAAYLSGADSNPLIYDNTPPTVTLNSSGLAALGQYGVELNPIYANYPGTTQHIAYYFMRFHDTTADNTTITAEQNANNFFKSYFDSNSKSILNYLKEYTTLTSGTGITQSAGYTLKSATDSSGNVTYSLGSVYSGSFETSSKQMTSTFGQLTTTLFSRKSSNVTPDDPYEYFVNETKLTEAVPAGSAMPFQNDSGDTVGIVSNGAYTIGGSAPEKLCVVIATGDVTVDRDFHGIIISGGNIILHGSVIADETNVTAAFSAKSGQYTLSDFLQNGAASSSTTTGGNDSSWNLDDLITYQNWKKD